MALGTPVAAAAAYSAAAGATSIAPAYPAGITATDALILFVGQKPTAANGGTVTTPTGWTLREELTAAGGYATTIGADTGNTNLRVYTKNTVDGTETGTLTVTLAGSDVAWAFIVQVPTEGGTLSYGSADGQRTTAPTANTPFAVALTNGTSATAFKQNDLALWAMCIPTDVTTPAQFSAQSITATGATFGAATEINEPDNTTGNDIGGYSAWARVTAGASTAAPTVTVTAGGTVTNVRGPIVLLRIRETFPPITGTFSATESADGFYSGARAPVLGAVSYTATAPATSISVAYPSGVSARDALVIFVAAKLVNSAVNPFPVDTLSIPSGWTYALDSLTSSGTPAGLDVGDITTVTLIKTATGSETGSVTINFSTGSTNIAWAVMVRYPAPPNKTPAYAGHKNQYQVGYYIGDLLDSAPIIFNPSLIDFSGDQFAFQANDVFIYSLAASTNKYGTDLFSGHVLGDGENIPPHYTLRPGIQINEFSSSLQTHIAGALAWSTVLTPESLPFLGQGVSLYLTRKQVADFIYVSYAGIRLRYLDLTTGLLSAVESLSDSFAARPPRPELGTRTGSFAATESTSDRLTDERGDAVNGSVVSPPVVGTIAYSATTTISPSYPAGIAANSIIVMFVAQKPSTANGGTITTPAGWTLQGQSLAGGGYGTTLGVDTGNQNIWVFTKTTVTGTETGTVAVTLGTTNTAWAAIAAIQRSNSHPLSFLTFAGESTTPSTFWLTSNSPTVLNPGDRQDVRDGDFFLIGASIASDNSTPSNFSGLTLVDNSSAYQKYQSVIELAEPDSAGGSDIGGLLAWTRALPSSNVFIYPYSLLDIAADVVDTTNSAGPSVVLRIRVEYPPATGNLAATEAADTFAGTGSAVSGVAGNLAVTEQAKDSLSATGRLIVRGSLAVAETGADALSAAGKVVVRGALVVTESGPDTLSIIGRVLVRGALAATESQDVFAAAGKVLLRGVLAATETGADAFASAGKVMVRGSLVVSETDQDVFIASGGTSVSGALSAVEAGADALTVTGTILVRGELAAIEQVDTLDAIGRVRVAGSLTGAEAGSDAFAASGGAVTQGALAVTETGQDTLAAAGSVLIRGALDAAETGSDSLAAGSLQAAQGTLAASEAAADAFAGSGTAAQPAPVVRDLDVHVLSPVQMMPTPPDWQRLIRNWKEEHHLSTGSVAAGSATRVEAERDIPAEETRKAAPRPRPVPRRVRTAASSGRLGVVSGSQSGAWLEPRSYAVQSGGRLAAAGSSAAAAERRSALRMSLGRYCVGGFSRSDAAPDMAALIAKRNAATIEALTKAGLL